DSFAASASYGGRLPLRPVQANDPTGASVVSRHGARVVRHYPPARFLGGFAQSGQDCRTAAVLASKCLPTVNRHACEGARLGAPVGGPRLLVHPRFRWSAWARGPASR